MTLVCSRAGTSSCATTGALHSCTSSTRSSFYRGAEAVSHGLTVQADHRDSPIAFYTVVDVPVAVVVLVLCRGAEENSHGPDCSSDHGYFPVTYEQGGRRPYLHVVRVSQVPSWRRRCALTVAPAQKLVTCSFGLRWRFFRAVYTGAGPGAVSTGTRHP